MTENKDKVVEVNGVWKIFGARADEALQAIRNDGLSKAEVLEKISMRGGREGCNLQRWRR